MSVPALTSAQTLLGLSFSEARGVLLWGGSAFCSFCFCLPPALVLHDEAPDNELLFQKTGSGLL